MKARARPHRASLLKRAALHGVKRLVRKHPGAALDAAGASIVYAGREAVTESADFVKEKVAELGDVLADTPKKKPRAKAHPSRAKVSRQDRKALIEKLGDKERRALARFAGHSKAD
jgi:plasmid stabilization system protein ParE